MIINIIFQILKEDRLHNLNINQEQDTFHQRILKTIMDLAKILEINFQENHILPNLIINNNLIKISKFHPQLWINNTLII